MKNNSESSKEYFDPENCYNFWQTTVESLAQAFDVTPMPREENGSSIAKDIGELAGCIACSTARVINYCLGK